jgi:hypothetical protein
VLRSTHNVTSSSVIFRRQKLHITVTLIEFLKNAHTRLFFRNLSAYCMCPSVCLTVILWTATLQTRHRPSEMNKATFQWLVQSNYPQKISSSIWFTDTPTCFGLHSATVIGKVHPTTGHEHPKGEQRCSSTLSLTSVIAALSG